MRTKEEIVERVRVVQKQNSFLDFESPDLIGHLPFAEAQEFLNAEAKANPAEWPGGAPWTDDEIIQEIKDYLPFAFEKCIDHRGISASRSIMHFRAWTWLLGRDDLVKFLSDSSNYAQYGAPMLKRIAEEFGVPVPADEDFAAMSLGDVCPSCRRGDESGCGG